MSESPWRVALALVLIGGMAGAGLWLVLSEPSAPETVVAVPSSQLTTVVPSTAAAGVESQPPATTGAESAQADQTAEVLLASTNALRAWGEFAITGDLTLLDAHFVEDGLQMEQFRAEAPALAATPAGPPPYEFLMNQPTVVFDDATAIVETDVVMSREGLDDQQFAWLIHLRIVGDQWMVWTVSDQGG